MMLKVERFLANLGWQSISPAKFISGCFASSSILLILIYQVTGSAMIAFSVLVCVLVQFFDSLKSRIQILSQKHDAEWPKFLDAIHSSAWSGNSLEQAILDSKTFAPRNLNWAITDLEKDLLSGLPLDTALVNLKARLGTPIVDRFVELTRLANQSGGRGYLAALRAQAVQLRLENATWSEVQVKQNWIISSAKLAVFAPWLVLILLSIRRETAEAFNTETGVMVLLIGLSASLFAFQLVKFLSSIPKRQRVLAG